MRRVTLMIALTAAGCGGGPRTYPVSGKVVGDVAALAGGHVEAALEGDPTVRASGAIGPDGSFRLESVRPGEVLRGAVGGTYRVRIVPPDDDPAAQRRARAALAPRFTRFETSRLTLTVPPADAVTFELSAR